MKRGFRRVAAVDLRSGSPAACDSVRVASSGGSVVRGKQWLQRAGRAADVARELRGVVAQASGGGDARPRSHEAAAHGKALEVGISLHELRRVAAWISGSSSATKHFLEDWIHLQPCRDGGGLL